LVESGGILVEGVVLTCIQSITSLAVSNHFKPISFLMSKHYRI
jgi:hypothetical protein